MPDANANMPSSEGTATNTMFEAPATDNGLMDEVNAFIAGFEDEQADAVAAQYKESENVNDDDGLLGVDEDAVSGTPDTSDKEDPGLVRLLAREQEVAAKERDFDKRLEAAVAAKVPSFKGKNHDEVLKMAGLDPELVLKQMMYERASDTNPVKAKLKEELRDLHHKKEIDSVRAELERRDMEKAQRDYYQSIHEGARQYVTTKVDEKVTPNFALVSKAKPEKMHARVMQVITQDASARLAKGEEGEPMAYADAAKVVEAELAEIAEVIRAGMVSVDPKKKNAAPTGSSKPVLKQPIIKKPATTDIDDEIQMAIRASEAIFHAEEAKSRGVRRK